MGWTWADQGLLFLCLLSVDRGGISASRSEEVVEEGWKRVGNVVVGMLSQRKVCLVIRRGSTYDMNVGEVDECSKQRSQKTKGKTNT